MNACGGMPIGFAGIYIGGNTFAVCQNKKDWRLFAADPEQVEKTTYSEEKQADVAAYVTAE